MSAHRAEDGPGDGQTNPSGAAIHADALLREAVWLRGVARALTRDEASAADLAQDVVAEALQARVPVEPGRLRGWLRTVARRRASHGRERALGARAVERDVARPEAISAPPNEAHTEAHDEALDAHERLVLHEELARELRALAPADRDLLLRRFFDGVPPRDLAREAGVTAEVMRKRLSRALARLRARLEHTERGQGGWAVALVGLAKPPNAPQVAAPTVAALGRTVAPKTVAGSATLMIMTVPKLVSLALVALLAVFFVVQQRTDAPVEVEGLDVVARDAAALESVLAQPHSATGRSEPMVSGSQATTAAPPTAVPQIQVVASTGEGLIDLHGAWIGADRRVHALEFDVDGIAERPNTGTFRLFVHVPGFVAHWQRVEDDGDVRVVLSPADVIEGIITVDGNPPGEWLSLRCSMLGEDLGLEDGEDLLAQPMRQIGALPSTQRVDVDAAGRFSLFLSVHARSVKLFIPPSFLTRSIDGAEPPADRTKVRLEARAASIRIDLAPLPAITGRYVWDDDGTPVCKPIRYTRLTADGYSVNGLRWTLLSPDGRFAIGVDKVLDVGEPVGVDGSSRSITERTLGERAASIRIVVDDRSELPGSERTVHISGDSFPIDVGVLRIPRPAHREVLVLGHIKGSWRPVAAVLQSAIECVTADLDGRATVTAGPGDRLDVIAAGFGLVRVRVDADTGDGPQVVRLEPAPSVTVVAGLGWETRHKATEILVRLTFAETPYGPWAPEASEEPAYGWRHHAALYGRWRSGLSLMQISSGWVEYYLSPSGSLHISGIRRGATFDVQLVDTLGQVLATESVVFDGAVTIDFEKLQLDRSWLTCSVFSADGAPVETGRMVLKGEDSNTYGTFDAHPFELGPFAPGLIRIHVESKGLGSASIEELRLSPGQNEITLTLTLSGAPK